MNTSRITAVVTAPAKRALGWVPAYVALQRAVGADRLRYRCIDLLELQAGERVLDVGCGPAYYLDALPKVDYLGFDTEPGYIAWAKRRWAGRGEFRCEQFTAASAEELGPFDAVMLMGLLHHLSDESCDDLLGLLAGSLTPRGRVITVDTAFVPAQRRLAHWMAANDRGEHVRDPDDFAALAGKHFAGVDTRVLGHITRVPSDYCVMRLTGPTPA